MKCHCNEVEELRERIDELEAAAAYRERQLESDRTRLARFRRMYGELGVENDVLREKLVVAEATTDTLAHLLKGATEDRSRLEGRLAETWDCATRWEARWQEADHKRELAEAKLASMTVEEFCLPGQCASGPNCGMTRLVGPWESSHE